MNTISFADLTSEQATKVKAVFSRRNFIVLILAVPFSRSLLRSLFHDAWTTINVNEPAESPNLVQSGPCPKYTYSPGTFDGVELDYDEGLTPEEWDEAMGIVS